jgi:hypothetical protein
VRDVPRNMVLISNQVLTLVLSIGSVFRVQGNMVRCRAETSNGDAAAMTNTISMGISLKGHTRSHVETT